jgi:proteasome alpha subunit
MTEEPYRWLEAIGNRREYIREQMRGGTPVFALSRPEGILLLGVGQGQSKVFEIYDRHAFAALGHPVDIEKLRQVAIEAAHLEGFNRSSKDVTLRRLISFALSTMLKNSFEQIFAPPFIVESVWAEMGDASTQDVLVRVHHDGNHFYEASGTLLVHVDQKKEDQAAAWLRQQLKPDHSLTQCAGICLVAWQTLVDDKPFAEAKIPESPPLSIAGKTVEAALLDRKMTGPVHYRVLDLKQASASSLS